MTVLLVLFTLIAFLVMDHFVQKSRTHPALARQPMPARASFPLQFPIHVPEGIALATNHTWSRTNHDGTITIGLDGLLSRIVGVVEKVTMPHSGEMTVPASADLSVDVKGRSLRFAAPLAGKVVETNTDVLKNPSLIATDPYGKGWLVRVKSAREDIAASKRYIVARPVEWLKDQVALVRDFIVMNAHQGQSVVLQEGGLPVDGVLQQFDDKVWKEFNRSFAALQNAKSVNREENGL